jgi:hypothetical protein
VGDGGVASSELLFFLFFLVGGKWERDPTTKYLVGDGGGVASSELLVFLWDKWGREEENNYLDLVGDGSGVASSELFSFFLVGGRSGEGQENNYIVLT